LNISYVFQVLWILDSFINTKKIKTSKFFIRWNAWPWSQFKSILDCSQEKMQRKVIVKF